MGMIDIFILCGCAGIFVVSLFIWWATRPEKCPVCGERMNHECRAKNGKEVCSQVCPFCGYEVELNVE